jgi:transposase
MYEPHDPKLKRLAERLSPDLWAERIARARERATSFERVHVLIEGGSSARQAIRDVFPGEPIEARYSQYLRYAKQGWEGLIDKRFVVRERKVTPEIEGFVRGLLLGHPGLRSPDLCQAVEARFDVEMGESTMREWLRGAGLSAPVGRPSAQTAADKAVPLPCAGAELLKAADLETCASSRLTLDLAMALGELEPPEGEVRDDRDDRDDRGRFLASYNEPEPRTEPELGAKFDSVELRREGKDLSAMRAANSSIASLHRKNVAMVMLPLLASSVRWDGVAHWKGEWLGELCGYPYKPATLDKHLREHKHAGVAEVAAESVARFWTSLEGPVEDPATGAVVLYADISTKPHWTHHFSRVSPIARMGGRVMPGSSTLTLHSGYGTPLIYKTFYGKASLPKEIGDVLERYERAAGEGTARRLVVMDREAHAAWLMKELDPRWLYVIPLKSNVTGPKAHFEELGEWEPYGERDRVRSGHLWLNDSKDPKNPLRVRVVGRHRGRSGKLAWFATNAPEDGFPAPAIVDAYFGRWPHQEQVYRDANAAVNMDARYGYGKKKVNNIAVLDGIERLDGQIRTADTRRERARVGLDELRAETADCQTRIAGLERHVPKLRQRVTDAMASGSPPTAQAGEDFRSLSLCEDWLTSSRAEAEQLARKASKLEERIERNDRAIERKRQERAKLESRIEVFTVDTELDEILLAYKLTFLNLCAWLLRHYFPSLNVETTTFIEHVLTLPGDRVRTHATETVRIYRQPRDTRFMQHVEKACELLTDRGLVRNDRRMRFEVIDPPG